MLTLFANSNPYGNWLINLSVLLYNSNVIITSDCDPGNGTYDSNMPEDWPCQWNNGEIPFAFDFFSLSRKRLISLVRKGHSHIEERSCLVFKEGNPRLLSARPNFTYLYYTYSEVLENCCLPFYTKPVGRRLVLITPVCTLPAEVAHVTLHALGLRHHKHDAFPDHSAMALMFATNCPRIEEKIVAFKKRTL